MKRVLLFSYHFPPFGGGGAQRPTKFARYLRDFGYEPLILTRPADAHAHRWAPPDSSLAGDLAADIAILRVKPKEPLPPGRWGSRLQRWFWLPSPWARWWHAGATETARTLTDADIGAVWAIMPPYESARAAEYIARKLDVPWIADLGDPWALDERIVYPTRWHRSREMRKMRRSLRTTAGIVMSTPEAAERLGGVFPEFQQKLVVAIPNGYDAADFESAPPPRTDSIFRIVHTGSLHTELALRQRRIARIRKLLGGGEGVDILTHSPVYLLRAVERLLRDDPSVESNIEVVFAGVLSEADTEIANPFPWTKLTGYIDHAASVALIQSADLLFLPMHNIRDGERASIVPGKTYEYLASGTRILAAVPEGDVKDIISEAGAAFVCRPDDVGGMVSALTAARRGEPFEARNTRVVSRFEYRNLTKQVASVLDQLFAKG